VQLVRKIFLRVTASFILHTDINMIELCNYVILVFGIHFFNCRSSYLPDDPAVRWREDIVANLILNHIEALSIDTVSIKCFINFYIS
jgi:hypothetical protein